MSKRRILLKRCIFPAFWSLSIARIAQSSPITNAEDCACQGNDGEVRSRKGDKSVYGERFLQHHTPVGRNPILIGAYFRCEVPSNDWSGLLGPAGWGGSRIIPKES